MTRIISLIIALAVAALPAQANFGNNFGFGGKMQPVVLAPTRVTCQTSTVDQQNYTFSSVATGWPAEMAGIVYVIALTLDSATAFNVTSLTVDGTGLSEINDDAGTFVASAAIYRTNSPLTGLDSIDVVVNNSEALSGAAACIWIYPPGNYTHSTGVNSNTNSAIMTVTLGAQQGYFAGGAACSSLGTSTWGVYTEREDAAADQNYSSADLVNTDGRGAASNSVTCDPTGTADSVMGAFALFPLPTYPQH